MSYFSRCNVIKVSDTFSVVTNTKYSMCIRKGNSEKVTLNVSQLPR
jgi:hypothetical protein